MKFIVIMRGAVVFITFGKHMDESTSGEKTVANLTTIPCLFVMFHLIKMKCL